MSKTMLIIVVLSVLYTLQGCAERPLFDRSKPPTYENIYEYYKGSRKYNEVKDYNEMIKDIYGDTREV
jgi:hypothetical protein